MDRRSFVKAGLAAVAASSVAGSRTATAQPTTGLDFDFTGLYAFQASGISKQLRVILVDGPMAGIKDQHAPLLVMRRDDYVPLPTGVNDPSQLHHSPKIVRLGGNLLAVWSLAGWKLWMGDAHTDFDGLDSSASLTVDDSSIDGQSQPYPPDDPAAWRSMQWFAEYEHLLGGAYEEGDREIAFDPRCIASMIRLTRGRVSGRMPLTQCERERTYRVQGSESRRTFNAQFHCAYEHHAGQTLLTVSQMDGGSPKRIGVEIRHDMLTPISVVNTSLTHDHRRHYEAFYGLACSSGKYIDVPKDCGGHVTKTAGSTATGQRPKLDSPDPDCIPPRARLA